jgi:hypothetical protein
MKAPSTGSDHHESRIRSVQNEVPKKSVCSQPEEASFHGPHAGSFAWCMLRRCWMLAHEVQRGQVAMTISRTPTLAFIVACGGALLLAASVSLSTLMLWHIHSAGGYVDTYVVAPVWLPVSFVACSALVLLGSAIVRRGSRSVGNKGSRLATVGAFLTAIAWIVCGILWLIMRS